MLWRAVAGAIAGCCAALLVIAFWPHIEPSAASVKAAVEQPVFVAQPVVISAPLKAPFLATRPIAKDAINKLANALRGPPTVKEPIASLSIPIDEARRLCAEGLVAFARATSRPREPSLSGAPKAATPGP